MTTDAPQEPQASTSTAAALDALIQVAATVEPAVARRAGLSTSELQALRHLVDRSRGPVELSHLLGVTSAASSGVVDRLAARGHVRRRPHPDDGRRTRVEVTESGPPGGRGNDAAGARCGSRRPTAGSARRSEPSSAATSAR